MLTPGGSGVVLAKSIIHTEACDASWTNSRDEPMNCGANVESASVQPGQGNETVYHTSGINKTKVRPSWCRQTLRWKIMAVSLCYASRCVQTMLDYCHDDFLSLIA